ncbi:hypothetical protein V5738_16790 [Salinisphaera sp. SPP-AMP-43]|uniref:hypothetical protein n=1 Tax=Salinisphaera sp. SPP-AMP-43 TaxID=3121288 RepID=UPI003C6E9ED5
MDILDSLAADHRRMRHVLEQISHELGRYLRARPDAVRRLRAWVDVYIDYVARVHIPRERCLRNYLGEHDDAETAVAGPGAWQQLRDCLARPLPRAERLSLRRRLVALMRASEEAMSHEEQALFVASRDRLSRIERHTLALRWMLYGPAAGSAEATRMVRVTAP